MDKISIPVFKLEPVKGCNMSCDFCGNYSFKGESIKFIKIKNIMKLVENILELTKSPKIEIAGRGEPILHKYISKILRTIRKNIPKAKIMLMTNEKILTKRLCELLFNNGLNLLVIDKYLTDRSTNFEGIKTFNSDEFNPWGSYSYKEKAVIEVKDIRKDGSKKRTIHSQCQAVNPAVYKKYDIDISNLPLNRVCVTPFRTIRIFYNGDIPFCCNDWIGHKIFGNIFESNYSLYKFWYTDIEVYKRRCKLLALNRKFKPCIKCEDKGGFYTHLLPTKEVLIKNLNKG